MPGGVRREKSSTWACQPTNANAALASAPTVARTATSAPAQYPAVLGRRLAGMTVGAVPGTRDGVVVV